MKFVYFVFVCCVVFVVLFVFVFVGCMLLMLVWDSCFGDLVCIVMQVQIIDLYVGEYLVLVLGIDGSVVVVVFDNYDKLFKQIVLFVNVFVIGIGKVIQ